MYVYDFFQANASLPVEILKAIIGRQSEYSPNLLFYLFLNKLFDVIVSDHSEELKLMKQTFLVISHQQLGAL